MAMLKTKKRLAFEDKYFGKKIRLPTWGKGEWFIPERIEGSTACGTDDNGDKCRCLWEDPNWELYEEEPELIQEKSIEDYPLVEVYNVFKERWEKARYVCTYKKSHKVIFKDPYALHGFSKMRPIQKVDVNDLKQKARLV
jgi:hypothetical protein